MPRVHPKGSDGGRWNFKAMKHTKSYLSSVLACLLATTSALATPVWHCSRNANQTASDTTAQADQFSIASFNSSADVIGVSVRDLIDVYSGTPVYVGRAMLSACFLVGNEPLTQEALLSLGIKPNAIEALSRKSAIVSSNLYYVRDESQMSACIAKNFPAVGYASKPIETPYLLPCF